MKNLKLSVVLLILMAVQTIAGNISFQKTFENGSNPSVGRALYVLDDGRILLGGSDANTGSANDMLLMELSPMGQVLSQVSFGTTHSDHDAIMRILDYDDGIITAVGVVNDVHGQADLAAFQYDMNTDSLLWANVLGGVRWEDFRKGAKAVGGGYFISSSTYSFPQNNWNQFIVKLDGSGNVEWKKKIGGSNLDRCKGMAATADGGCVLTGWTMSNTAYVQDMFLTKLDSSGNMEWSRNYDYNDYDQGKEVMQTDDGGYMIAGNINHTDPSFSPHSSQDVVLIKTDSLGNMEWNVAYSRQNREKPEKMIRKANGNYVIAGYTENGTGGAEDAFAIEVEPTGNIVWGNMYGGSNDDYFFDVAEASNGNLLFTGYSHSFSGSNKREAYLVRTDNVGNSGCNQYAWADTNHFELWQGNSSFSVSTVGNEGTFNGHWTVEMEDSVLCESGTGSSCEEAAFLEESNYSSTEVFMTDSVMWLKFVATDSIGEVLLFQRGLEDEFNVTSCEVFSSTCSSLQPEFELDSLSGYFTGVDTNFIIDSIYYIKIVQYGNYSEFELAIDYERNYVPFMIITYVPDSAITVTGENEGIIETDNPTANGLFLKHNVTKFERAFPLDNYLNKDYWLIECDNCYERILGEQFVKNLAYSEEFALNKFLEYDCNKYTPRPNDLNVDFDFSGPIINNISYFNLINGECAWNISRGDENTLIAVLDNNFDTDHEDLENQIVIHRNLGAPDPDEEHGMLAAGLIGAENDNNKGIAGIAGESKLLLYEVNGFEPDPSGGVRNAPILNAARGVNNAIVDGAKVINMSFGIDRDKISPQNMGYYTTLLENAIHNATNNDVLCVASAGNSGHDGQITRFPSDLNEVLAVSSVDVEGYHGTTSTNRGQHIDICAPGGHLVTLLTNDSYATVFSSQAATSWSTAIVSGVCGLIRSRYPCLTPAQVIEIVRNSGNPTNDSHLFPGELGGGVLDAHQALLDAGNYTPTKINSNVTWNNNQTFLTGIEIEAGGVLEITSTIRMAKDAKIVVKNGGKLILNGGKITNVYTGWYPCDGLWPGIEVWGNPNTDHPSADAVLSGTYPSGSSSEHGVVVLKNGAVIENAVDGISTLKKVSWEPYHDAGYFGGIIIAEDATFTNCVRAVAFMQFKKHSNSYFKDVVFETTKYPLDEGRLPKQFVTAWDVNGVEFTDCKFINEEYDQYQVKDRGVGILCHDGKIKVENKGSCTTFSESSCVNWAPDDENGFENLTTGVILKGFSYAFSITYTGFRNNQVGISMSGTYYGPELIYRNEFEIADVPNSIGIYLLGSSLYNLQENTFILPDNEHARGIYTLQTNTGYLYKNTFESASNNSYAFTHSFDNPYVNLSCNEVLDPMKHIVIMPNASINESQGVCNPGGPYFPAGNVFNSSCYGTDNWHIYTGQGAADLNYCWNMSHSGLNPFCLEINSNITGSTTTTSPDCSSQIVEITGGSGSGGYYGKRAELAEINAIIEDQYTILDDGNTAQLLDKIHDEQYNTTNLYNELKEYTPYLSNEALIALMYRSEFSGNNRSHLLIENAPHSHIVWKAIEDSEVFIHADSMNTLKEIQEDTALVSPRKVLIDSLNFYKQQKRLLYMDMMYYAKIDSNYNLAEVMDSLQGEQDIELRLLLADLYIAEEEYNEAEAVYDSLKIYFKEHMDLLDLREIQLQVYTTSMSYFVLEGTYEQDIEDIAFGDTSIAAYQARNILELIRDTIYPKPYEDIPGGSSKWDKEQPEVKENEPEIAEQYHLYPNPLENRQAIIDMGETEDGILHFYNINGVYLGNKPLAQGINRLDLSNITTSSGVYIYQISVEGKTKKRDKLIVLD